MTTAAAEWTHALNKFFQAMVDVGDDGVASVRTSADLPAELERLATQISADRALVG